MTSEERQPDTVSVGPVQVEVRDRERVNIPLWAGAAIAIFGGILLARKGKD